MWTLCGLFFPSGKEVYGREEESKTQDEKEVTDADQRVLIYPGPPLSLGGLGVFRAEYRGGCRKNPGLKRSKSFVSGWLFSRPGSEGATGDHQAPVSPRLPFPDWGWVLVVPGAPGVPQSNQESVGCGDYKC